jgi:hypothetical protein
LGATVEKKKKFFSNFSSHVEDTEKYITDQLFVSKNSMSDQNFKGIAQKKDCHVLENLKIEMSLAGSFFESPNFLRSHIS